MNYAYPDTIMKITEDHLQDAYHVVAMAILISVTLSPVSSCISANNMSFDL